MESLKRLIPDDLKQTIHNTSHHDLARSCSQLLDFFQTLPQFHKLIGELAGPELGLCRKSLESALDFKKKGNERFCGGDYRKAWELYSQALRCAPAFSNGPEGDLIAKLYINRASSMHKLELFEECKHDCDRAIAYSSQYAKAWYRRGKANASLKYYDDATRDFRCALSLNISSSERRHIQGELEVTLRLFDEEEGTTESRAHGINSNLLSYEHMDNKQCQIELHCVSTSAKGRGMVSAHDVPPATVIHQEEPFVAIVLKSCRESHCHYCFSELPADTVFCSCCVTPVYCSSHCQEQAGLEHGHECGGTNWPVVLPSEVVLAGRVAANFIIKNDANDPSKSIEHLDFVHNYHQELPERKLELHIYSIVLSYCLHKHFGPKFSVTGVTASQVAVLLSQIRANGMAVTCMKSTEYSSKLYDQNPHVIEDTCTSNIKQVRVGQAIYLTGRFFNHSCQPNIHAYFLSRKLFLRSIEFVPAGCPLELSYGPQVGQCDYMERQISLKNEYSFVCRCSGCSEANLSDIVLHSFRCSQSNCLGAIPNSDVYNKLKDPEYLSSVSPPVYDSFPVLVSEEKHVVMEEVAYLLVHRRLSQIVPGHCLRCGSFHDLILLNQQAADAMSAITKLQQDFISGSATLASVSIAVNALNCLTSIRHAYSKDVACAEDIIAEAYCLMGMFESALKHCQASLKILKNLYSKNHIVIGNELVKLASIQLHLGHHSSAMDSIRQLEEIFSLHYGSHAAKIFPYLKYLGQKSCQNLPI